MNWIRKQAAACQWALVALTMAAAPAAAQQSLNPAPHLGPLRTASVAAVPVRAPSTFITPAPAFRAASPAIPRFATTLLLLGAGIGMTAGGRELQSSIGFPGAVVRYTGISITAAGVLSICGCL